jgi:hypothetical protein
MNTQASSNMMESDTPENILKSMSTNMNKFLGIDKELDILPPISEIHYCLKRNILSSKDLIMCKLILDAHLAMYQKKVKSENEVSDKDVALVLNKLVPCSK